MATKRSVSQRIEIGVGLISFSILIAALAITVAGQFSEDLGLRLVILAFGVAIIAVLWTAAVRNSRIERNARTLLREQHPGALVERIRLWALPHGRAEPHIPMHFLVADANEISIEDIEQTVLVRIPVEELGFVGTARAKGDSAKDAAITLVYGDEKLSVQFFSITYATMGKLLAKLRVAIGWPAEDAP